MLTFISVQRYTKVRTRNTTPSSAFLLETPTLIFSDRYLCSNSLVPASHRSNEEQRKKHWTRMEYDLWPWTFLAVCLWILHLTFLRALFLHLQNRNDIYPFRSHIVFLSMLPTRVKMLLHLLLLLLPCQGFKDRGYPAI